MGCLGKIGRHIDLLPAPMSDDKAREWRSHLWFFVSNFTEFDAMKLFKLYRHAVKKDIAGAMEEVVEIGTIIKEDTMATVDMVGEIIGVEEVAIMRRVVDERGGM